MSRACSGVRVLELTYGTAGQLATMNLADSGADVLHVELSDRESERERQAGIFLNRG